MYFALDLRVVSGWQLLSSTTNTVDEDTQKDWSSSHNGDDEFRFKTEWKV